MFIRKVILDDIPFLSRLAKVSFREAYKYMFDQGLMEDYIKKVFSEAQLTVDLKDPKSNLYIALKGEVLLGYLKLREGGEPKCDIPKGTVEVERIYADPAQKHQGIGKLLMATALKEARAMGFKGVWLGLFQKNINALHFYEAQGFSIVGETIFMMGDEPQKDYIMAKEL